MALLYLDTSALAKVYIREAGRIHMLRLLSDEDNQFAISAITPVELHSAIRRRQL